MINMNDKVAMPVQTSPLYALLTNEQSRGLRSPGAGLEMHT